MNGNRNITIDIMKGFLIIFVIIGHSWWVNRNIIFWFHMPLFFMISGYLIKLPETGHEKEWIYRKMRLYLVPYAIYALLLGFTKIGEGYLSVIEYWIRTLYGGKMANGVYWFITVLLFSEIAIVFVESKVKNKTIKLFIYGGMYSVAILVSIFLMPTDVNNMPLITRIPGDLDVCFMAIPCLIIGYQIRCKRRFLEKKKTEIILFSCFVSFGLIAFLIKSHAISWFVLDMKYSQYRNAILDILCPAVIGVFILAISHAFSKSKWGGVHHVMYWASQFDDNVSSYCYKRLHYNTNIRGEVPYYNLCNDSDLHLAYMELFHKQNSIC